MIPPSFSDLNKATKELFSKNFYFGILSADYLTKSPQGIELSIKGDSNIKTGDINGSLEWKYKFENGLKNSIKWDTKNVLSSNFSIEDMMVTGSRFSIDLGFNPDSGNKTLKIQSGLKRNYFNIGIDLSFPNVQPVLTKYLTICCVEGKGYVAGAEFTYDTGMMSLTKHKFSIGYRMENISILGSVVNSTNFESSIYQKVSPELDLGVQIKWDTDTRNTDFGIVTKYAFHPSSFVKAKINSASILGLAYCFSAMDGMKITLNVEIDAKNIEGDSNKFGLGLSYAP